MTICRRRRSSSTVCLLQRRQRRLYATVENSSSGSSERNVGIINVVIMKTLNSTIFFYNWSVSTRIRNGTTAFFIALGFFNGFCLMRCIDLCKSCLGVSGDAPMVRVKCFIAKSSSLTAPHTPCATPLSHSHHRYHDSIAAIIRY